jgi:Antitoxin VbhA
MNKKPSADEIERRRHVRTADADNRIEGMIPPSRAVLEICAAYIRGEIEAHDLVAVYKKAQQLQ